MVVPVVGLGALAVFAIGYILVYNVLKKLVNRRKGNKIYYRDNKQEIKFHDDWTEDEIDRFAKIGGGVAVAITLIVLFSVPREYTTVIWIGLLILGFVFAMLISSRR